ncbi:MAG: NAD(P)/FAD-dependent oxidoreductase [Firmicutes bacterium]|nr:NAD(P)/FAD-dependent oxidoreductase [Bacillota bacterium]
MKTNKICVIGAGAAGMMAAIRAAECGAEPVILERNERPGRKLLITGKGRCNLTNNCSVPELVASVPVNGRFLYGAFSRFCAQDMMDFLENAGLPLKTERGNRVFPCSDRAMDVVDTLDRLCRELGCRRLQERAQHLLTAGGTVRGVQTESGRELTFERVILCTGGLSYPTTGSTGDGFRMAAEAGHTVTPPQPSLVPFEAEEDWCRDLMGLSLRNVGLKIVDRQTGRALYEDFGEMLFTHFGISGPMVLSASSHIRRMEPGRYSAQIDLKPALSEEQLDARLLREFGGAANRELHNVLPALLPHKMVPVFLRISGIPPETKINQITREIRRRIISLLKCFPVSLKRFRPVEEAIITSGGVCVKEIDPKTMESRLIKGLYFAGEIIDADAYTGGFNLQIAWSTGRLAGESAAADC